MKIKNVMLTGLSFVLTAAVAIGGTLAYLQSEDSDVNVMTLGNVKIEQHEYQRVTNEDGTYKTDTIDSQTSYVLETFDQGKPLYPIVGDPSKSGDNPAYAGYDDIIVRMTQVDSYGGMQVFAGKNAQDKFVTVENTGKSDAYIRTYVAIEIGEGDSSLIGTSYHKTWSSKALGSVVIDDNTYYVYEYSYVGGDLGNGSWRHKDGILPAGDTSYPNLSQVYLKSEATNEDMDAIDGNGNGTLDILVLSQAIQVAGFDNAATAFNAGFGEATKENIKAWFEGTKVPVIIEKDTAAEKVAESLENGQDLYVDESIDMVGIEDAEVDGKGATVTLEGQGEGAYGYFGFVPGKDKDAKVENITVTGSGFVEVGHYGEGGGNYVVNNLVIENFESTLGVTDGANKVAPAFCHYGDAVMNNCVMTGSGTKAEGATAYDVGFVNGTTTVINGGEYGKIYLWAQAHVTINGAKVDTIDSAAITTRNLGMLTIGAGAEVGTINLIPAGTYPPALKIEEGAKVGKIVYDGQTYTAEEWMSR